MKEVEHVCSVYRKDGTRIYGSHPFLVREIQVKHRQRKYGIMSLDIIRAAAKRSAHLPEGYYIADMV